MMDLNEWSEPIQLAASDACLSGCDSFSQGRYFHAAFPDFILTQICAYKLLRATFNHGNCKNLGQILERQENSFIL